MGIFGKKPVMETITCSYNLEPSGPDHMTRPNTAYVTGQVLVERPKNGDLPSAEAVRKALGEKFGVPWEMITVIGIARL